jgi:hypothetical protein
MEESFETQSRARLGQLLTESRRTHRRSLSFSYASGTGLEALLLANEVAEQMMANLRSFAHCCSANDERGEDEATVGGGGESGAEWERVKEGAEKIESEKIEERQEKAKATGEEERSTRPTRAPCAPGSGDKKRRHTRSFSDSGVVVVLQMADANQRARDRRRAQWEKKKKAEEEVREKKEGQGEEERFAEEQRKERERAEKERKAQEALAAKNERLLKLFVKNDEQCAQRQKSESDRVTTCTAKDRKREESSGEGEDQCVKALRSGSDVESAEEVNLGVEEWERQQQEDDEEDGELWENDKEGGKEQKKKIKLRLMKMKPKIISGRRKSKEREREREQEKIKEKDGKKKRNGISLALLQSSPM